ncbi:phosphotransferase [Frigoribacterium sp. ACAM 257]|uniref:phosphotransferase n=1 Tax=Frigoribacterium sp. ACAM 257 TaxID=2508998 RepID=UPI00174E16B7|nr:phosphotransferase [Frigoribacterium sp. ACAM 257]
MDQHRHDDDHEDAAVLESGSSPDPGPDLDPDPGPDLDLDPDLDPDPDSDPDEGSLVSFAALAVDKLVSPARGTRQGVLLPGVDTSVVRIWGDGVDVVVRTPRDTAGPDTYPAEEWAAEHAARHGVRTPRVLARESEFGEGPLMIVEHVTSIASDRDPWHDLGRLAAALAEVHLDAVDPASVEPDGVDPHVPDSLFTRFGRDLPEAWRRHVRYGLDSLVPGDRLLGLGVYTERQRGPLRTALEQLVDESEGWRHGLVHGDLAPRNLVPRGPGDPVLIDWGTARTGPVPWLELDRVHRWSVVGGVVTADELRRFAAGLGVDLDDSLPTLRRLALLHHLDLVRWALEHRPDRLAREVEEARRAIARCLP